jgi:perosamine synthetase
MSANATNRPLSAHRPSLGPRETAAVQQVFDSRWLGRGEATQRFERALADYLGERRVVAVNSGTAALHVALCALGIPRGSEVLVPSLTFVATVQAILAAGARPVFCEVETTHLTVDVDDVRRRITPRTSAILPVHYAGTPCDLDALLDIGRTARIPVVEDAAHAFGSSLAGRRLGSFGDVTCFSFDPIKNITCGEGGAIATGDDEVAGRARRIGNLGLEADGWARRSSAAGHEVGTPGFRYHLSSINAAIGLAQLDRLETFERRKHEIVRAYDRAFESLDRLTIVTPWRRHVHPFSYVVRVRGGARDALRAYLVDRDIGTTVEYVPNHLQPLCAAWREPLPVTEQVAREILTLPLFVEMTDEDVARVSDAVAAFFAGAPPA